jgi:hypothetical protein
MPKGKMCIFVIFLKLIKMWKFKFYELYNDLKCKFN